jgi:hypothetical protein
MYYKTTNFLIAHAALPICYLNYLFWVKSCLLSLDILGLPLPSQKAEGRWDPLIYWQPSHRTIIPLNLRYLESHVNSSVERGYYYKHQNCYVSFCLLKSAQVEDSGQLMQGDSLCNIIALSDDYFTCAPIISSSVCTCHVMSVLHCVHTTHNILQAFITGILVRWYIGVVEY